MDGAYVGAEACRCLAYVAVCCCADRISYMLDLESFDEFSSAVEQQFWQSVAYRCSWADACHCLAACVGGCCAGHIVYTC